jgi:hypothetical protein
MEPKIKFKNIWMDDDMFELEIVTFSESSSFRTKVYVGYPNIEKISEDLDIFKTHIHGGLYDMTFGEFGPEYGSGAFSIRFHFQQNGKLNLTIKIQTEYYSFGNKEIADEATMHLKTEPALFDNFISTIKSISKVVGNEIDLICIRQ